MAERAPEYGLRWVPTGEMLTGLTFDGPRVTTWKWGDVAPLRFSHEFALAIAGQHCANADTINIVCMPLETPEDVEASRKPRKALTAATEYRRLVGLLGVALTGLRAARQHYDADDMYLANVEAGLRDIGIDPEEAIREAEREDS